MSSWKDVQPSSSSGTSSNETRTPAKYSLNLSINFSAIAPRALTIRARSGATVDREGGGRSTPPSERVGVAARASLSRGGGGSSGQASVDPSSHTSPLPQPSTE